MYLATLLTIFTPIILICATIMIVLGFYTQYLNLCMLFKLMEDYPDMCKNLKFRRLNMFRINRWLKFVWKTKTPHDEIIDEYKGKIREYTKINIYCLGIIVVCALLIFTIVIAFGIYE